MTKFFPSIYLSIRQKVVVGFVLSMIAVLLIGFVTYRNLLRIDLKLRFVISAYSLHDSLLEVRRYEKNFLLYGLNEDQQAAFAYLNLGKKTSAKVEIDVKGLDGAVQLEKLQQKMASYGELLKELVAVAGSQNSSRLKRDEIELELRKTGKDLVDLSLSLADFEYSHIKQILQSLITNLGYILLVLLLLGLFLTVIVTRKIVRPLSVIEKTTKRIAQGDFTPLPVLGTRDETQSVVEAFNKMVRELEKRQDQLVQAQKLSSLGILTSGIAHQLNNPLNNISTSCQILMEEIHDGDQHVERLLSNIDHEVDRARDIVKGLLEFSRERNFQLSWVNLENLVVLTTRLVSSQLPAGVEIASEIPKDLDIFMDTQKLQEVLINLFLNAAQAMPDGKGQINITARKGRQNVEIDIQDNGCGIPPSDLPYIFDPFFTTKEVGYGTGLGLSVAHGIIEQHGGTLSAKSSPAEGTVFTIKVPLTGQQTPKSQLHEKG
jgi:two-component system NtrC family sensor kinase